MTQIAEERSSEARDAERFAASFRAMDREADDQSVGILGLMSAGDIESEHSTG